MRRARQRARQRGFTFTELLIVVAVFGTLAAIAVPAFVEYIRRSYDIEASANVRNLFTGAAAYYHGAGWTMTSRPAVLDAVEDPPDACTVASAVTSNTPRATPTALDWTMESSSFAALGFEIGDPVHYQYTIVSERGDACGHGPRTFLYRFQVRGDRDGDGVQSFFEISAGSNADNELVRSPGIYIERELE